ncbi:hypothetical protein GALMADRAFT_141352 [Galerina marginata CBS 339.88]|uniref:Uncharacterized protein n=1 Tax=Galerina marginata (strain CBS 339.88) TaxID=685588 RepID=A0A067STR2_GALM3|nr:hypothetical protein GALMADRAFT_141352 [Galerina marginata CBS 339.88]
MQTLSPDVKELIEQTIKLVDLIYWKPEVKSTPDNQRAATMMRTTLCALQGRRYSMDTDLGIQTHGDEADDIRRPGVNATFEERKEYAQFLISARDLVLDSDDEDLFKSLGLEPDF